MSSIKSLRNVLEQRKGQLFQLKKSLEESTAQRKENGRSLRQHEQAREIIKEVGLKTQQQLQYHISDITSLALTAVFDDPYELKAEFVQRRNKTECDLLFVRGDDRLDPLSASGGGPVDVASFALRIAAWSMSNPRSRNTIVLDEPLRFLSEEYQEKAALMIKEVSDKLGIQFLIITHNATLAAFADKTFEVRLKNKVTQIIEK